MELAKPLLNTFFATPIGILQLILPNVSNMREQNYNLRFGLPPEDFGNTAVWDLEDSGDITGPRAGVRQFDNLLPRRVRQGAPVHVHATQLVHTAVTWNVVVWKLVDFVDFWVFWPMTPSIAFSAVLTFSGLRGGLWSGSDWSREFWYPIWFFDSFVCWVKVISNNDQKRRREKSGIKRGWASTWLSSPFIPFSALTQRIMNGDKFAWIIAQI